MGRVGLGYPLSEYCYAMNGRGVLKADEASEMTQPSLLAWYQKVSLHQAPVRMQSVSLLGQGHDLLGRDPGKK